jgi:hypothetical protein
MTAQPQAYASVDDAEMDAQLLNPPDQSQERTVFGQVTVVDRWFCVLERGVGKRLYDQTRDSLDQRRVAIKFQITAPKREGGTYTIDREMVDFSDEWKKFTLPSIQKLNIPILNLRLAYVRLTLKPAGTYTKSGTTEQKTKTAIVFEEIFADEATCFAASHAHFGTRSNGQDVPQATQAAQDSTQVTQAGSQPENAAERAFAASTLPMLWSGCGQDRTKFLQILATSPVMNRYFNANSPEVTTLPDFPPF